MSMSDREANDLAGLLRQFAAAAAPPLLPDLSSSSFWF
jgi:hypothetical protein